MNDYPRPPFSEQKQEPPGRTNAMRPKPDHGETSYRGSGKLKGRNAVITAGTAASAARLQSRSHAKAPMFLSPISVRRTTPKRQSASS